jgi:hypothetical protein
VTHTQHVLLAFCLFNRFKMLKYILSFVSVFVSIQFSFHLKYVLLCQTTNHLRIS